MPAARCLISVKGVQDVEFLARMLKEFGYSRKLASTLSQLPKDLHRLVPERSSDPERRLHQPLLVPLFLADGQGSFVALGKAEGIENVANTLVHYVGLVDIDGGSPDAIAVVLDADAKVRPAARHQELLNQLGGLAVHFPDSPGLVTKTHPRAGVYVMPDNSSPGTLEDLLLDCGREIYPSLNQESRHYVERVKACPELTPEDLKEFNKPAGSKKAIVGAIGSVLRPGKAIQTSITDDRWIEPRSLVLPRVARLLSFLAELIDKPAPPVRQGA